MNSTGGYGLMPGLSVVRIPEWILHELPDLERLRQFAPILARFATEYRTLIDSAAWSDEQQAALLKQTLQLLLGCDRRFAGSYNPLALLNFFEQTQGAAATTTFTRSQIFCWAASSSTVATAHSTNSGRCAFQPRGTCPRSMFGC